MADSLGYYKILGVTNKASGDELKHHYRDKAKLWHPDYNTGEEAKDKFQKLSVAYDVLKDDVSRLFYDLLSEIYAEKDFPDMFALKVFTDQKGQENPDLRAFFLKKIYGKIYKSEKRVQYEICNEKEALPILFKASASNWFLGWWGWPAFSDNIFAIKSNLNQYQGSTQKTFSVLVHNALAYFQENKKDKALYSAVLAKNYAQPFQKELLDKLIYQIGENPQNIRISPWNYVRLKYIQLVVPLVLVLGGLSPLGSKVMTETELWDYFKSKNEYVYNQEVRFNNGMKTFDDMAVSRILNIPADTSSMQNLYHLKYGAKIMYGPSEEFDVLAELKGRTTVRLTGKSPDDVWARVMIDNGEMGFVKMENLNEGIGRDIPLNSKIYTGPR